MSRGVSYNQVVARLDENSLSYGTVTLQNDMKIVISQRGGRIFGPFLPGRGESALWINSAFARSPSFKGFLSSGNWNLGGERVFIAPEIQYCVVDRGDFWGTYRTPKQVDPGRYHLVESTPNEWQLSQDLTLQVCNVATGEKDLHLKRVVRTAADPLGSLSAYEKLMDGVLFAGYEQVVTLTERKLDDIMSEIWDLAQLRAGGELLIPASPRVEVTNYHEPVGENHIRVHSNHVRLQITGDRMYKVGFKAPHVTGRAGYFNHFSDGRAYLIIRNFFNNPSAPYVEEPYHSVGERGLSTNVYNDDGALGDFGELECNGQTIGGETGRSTSTDQMVLWLYVGPDDKLQEIALHLLGVGI